ncbi:MAG: hypothetical protein JWM11_4583 [Planctomycetaceae bacterium]|nr:hypothetical protein [Planctomycetaceae bacterium]
MVNSLFQAGVFELVSFQLTNEYAAVMADPDNPGTTITEPVDAMGIVREFVLHNEEGDMGWEPRLVALKLGDDLQFYVVNEVIGFKGIVRRNTTQNGTT